MFEDQPSEKSQKFRSKVLSQDDGVMHEQPAGNSERRIENQSEGNDEEGKVNTEQTDEKLFLESTGFGDNKRS